MSTAPDLTAYERLQGRILAHIEATANRPRAIIVTRDEAKEIVTTRGRFLDGRHMTRREFVSQVLDVEHVIYRDEWEHVIGAAHELKDPTGVTFFTFEGLVRGTEP